MSALSVPMRRSTRGCDVTEIPGVYRVNKMGVQRDSLNEYLSLIKALDDARDAVKAYEEKIAAELEIEAGDVVIANGAQYRGHALLVDTVLVVARDWTVSTEASPRVVAMGYILKIDATPDTVRGAATFELCAED